ncbi:hypothetical protein TNCV_1844441 [Trichonephila clavipes]|nr:hypothetical protein TNCV_1844441 [Trichonephila clavipes]
MIVNGIRPRPKHGRWSSHNNTVLPLLPVDCSLKFPGFRRICTGIIFDLVKIIQIMILLTQSCERNKAPPRVRPWAPWLKTSLKIPFLGSEEGIGVFVLEIVATKYHLYLLYSTGCISALRNLSMINTSSNLTSSHLFFYSSKAPDEKDRCNPCHIKTIMLLLMLPV